MEEFLFQVSFVVPAEVIPGRLGLLLTLLLCMINTLNSVIQTTPEANDNTTAIIYWIISCMLAILVALGEYFAILLRKKYFPISTVELSKTKEAFSETKGKKIIQDQEIEWSKKLDMVMLIVFPLVFTIFSILFWTCINPDYYIGAYQ